MFAVVRLCAAAAFAAAAVGRLDVPRGLNNNTQNNNRNHCLFLEHSHQLTILHVVGACSVHCSLLKSMACSKAKLPGFSGQTVSAEAQPQNRTSWRTRHVRVG